MRRMMRGMRHGRHVARVRPEREWVALNGSIQTVNTGSVTTGLLGFEAPQPAFGTVLTADAPEDRTILRVVAELSVSLIGLSALTLGIILVDRTWTPSGTFPSIPDLDKRFLWYRTYGPGQTGATFTWVSGLALIGNPATAVAEAKDRTDIDITPKVKLEDGKQLVMVAYCNNFTGAVSVNTMRLLLQRRRR